MGPDRAVLAQRPEGMDRPPPKNCLARPPLLHSKHDRKLNPHLNDLLPVQGGRKPKDVGHAEGRLVQLRATGRTHLEQPSHLALRLATLNQCLCVLDLFMRHAARTAYSHTTGFGCLDTGNSTLHDKVTLELTQSAHDREKDSATRCGGVQGLGQ